MIIASDWPVRAEISSRVFVLRRALR